MELNKEQLTKLKGYICNINFDHELYGVEKTVKLLGIESAELDEIITNKTIETEVSTVLSNSFGFGGTNSALVIKKCV